MTAFERLTYYTPFSLILGIKKCLSSSLSNSKRTLNLTQEAKMTKETFMEGSILTKHDYALEAANQKLSEPRKDIFPQSLSLLQPEQSWERRTQQPWTSAEETILNAPYDYLSQQPGKNTRSKLIFALNTWHKAPLDKVEVIVDVVGMLHTASLL
jgi:hypothetical protein